MTHTVITRAADVRPQRITFLWHGRIATGTISLIVGAPGVSKSMLTCLLAAGLSRGELKGSHHGEPADTLFVSVEDDCAAVIRPRLEAANADLERIRFLDVETDDEETIAFTLPDHFHLLADAVWQHKPALVVLDPINAIFSSAIDTHKDAAVRRVLSPISKLAQEVGTAIVAVTHTNKSQGGDAMRRVGGSIAFSGAPRNALLLAHDPNDPDGERGRRRLLAHFKTNTGIIAPTLAFEVKPILLHVTEGQAEIDTARLVLTGESTLGSTDLLAPPDADDRTETDEAEDLLQGELGEGERPAAEIHAAASEAGISKKAVRRARERLGITSERRGFGSEGAWYWRLPETIDAPESPIDAYGAPSRNGASMADGGHLWEPEVER
jgi:hypothetical protein